jgi:hypothetical protein
MTGSRLAATSVALLRSRTTAVAAAALALLALGGGAWPVLEVPGFELGLLCSLAFAIFLGPALAFAAARREDLTAGEGPRSALRPFAAAALCATGLLALVAALAALRAALATPCRPLAGIGMFALTAWPSALLAVALGAAAARVAPTLRRAALGHGGRSAALLYGAAALVSLAATLRASYFGPSASAYDHLFGIWPGPLYDEALPIDARLLLFRAGTLAWVAAVLAAAEAAVRRRAGGRWRAAAAVAAVAVGAAFLARGAGGGPASRAELAGRLGRMVEGPRCVVHLPAERSAAEAEAALRDCEYDAQAVAGALGLARPPRATVWLYRSPEEKRRLVGAGQTSFTKPWLAEIHLNDEGVPHPLLRHELVHALASSVARGPLRVPARAGVWINAGLVEGLAVALEVPSGEYGVHAWTRALRDQGRLPPLASLLGAAGFFGAAPARAYTAAGSFLRFLLDRDGPAPVLAAYASGDVAAAFGRPLSALEAEWQRFLDGVVVPPALAAAAEARFERASLFARSCGREEASLEERAGQAAAAGRAAAAEALLRRASALSGGDPALLRGAADAWRAAGDLPRAEAILTEALAAAEKGGGRRQLRASLLGAVGDLRWRQGDAAGAEARYRAALALGPGGAEARSLAAKSIAAAHPRVGAALGPWLLGAGDPAVALARVAQSDTALGRYLLARAQLLRGAPATALQDLQRLDPTALPNAAFGREAQRLAAQALCLAGRWGEGIAAWKALAAGALSDGLRESAEDGARRCAFERDAYGEPIRWAGDGLPR